MTELMTAIVLLSIITVAIMFGLFLAIGGVLALVGVAIEWIGKKIMELANKWRNDE